MALLPDSPLEPVSELPLTPLEGAPRGPLDLSPPTLADLLDAADVAALTGLAKGTVVSYAMYGYLPSLYVGRARMFDRRAVVAWDAARPRRKGRS